MSRKPSSQDETGGAPEAQDAATDAPGSLDGVEISMEAEREDKDVDSDARVLLRRQTQLIRRQVLSESLNVGLKAVGGVIGLMTAVLILSMVWNAARSNAVVVQALDTPPALAEKGLSGTVVAGRLQDGLTRIQATTRAAAKGRSIANAWTDAIAVEVPQTGISISELDRLLRQKLGRNTYVSGDLIQTADGRLALTVRGGGILARTFTGPEESLDALAQQAAEYIYGEAEPYIYASYLNQTGRFEEVVAFVGSQLPSARPDQRPPLANALGVAHASLEHLEDSAAAYRLAIRLDPTYWRAWGNLVGVLYYPGNEERALLAGRAMRRADEASKTTHPALTDYVNIAILEQDWGLYIDGVKEDAEATGGGSFNAILANPSLAEAEARRHDWSAAAHYMALSDRDTGSIATGQVIDAYRAMEAGDLARMIAVLEPFDQTWRTDSDIAFTYPDAPCWLGYAYALSGQAAKARAIFDRMGALVVCYAFEADGIEASGDRAAADTAYQRAIALAPSMPFAYQRRALALMARGQPVLAANRFRDAHQRGPRWADPLKGWGDALAAQGKWAEAAAKYEQAAERAPRWRELHLAWAVALDRTGKRSEAARQREIAAAS